MGPLGYMGPFKNTKALAFQTMETRLVIVTMQSDVMNFVLQNLIMEEVKDSKLKDNGSVGVSCCHSTRQHTRIT
jgi:hypothetical protein